MSEEENKSELKSEIARHKPRDEEGHFVHVEEPKPNEPPKDPISKFFSEHTSYHRNQDDILDIHVGNPLRKIVDLLEEIKKQKAFSFTLKGSLGVAGVILTLSVFGIFGAGNLLCDKGQQTQIGTVRVLNIQEKDPDGLPILSNILDWFDPKMIHQRVVLIKENRETLKIPFSKQVNIARYANYPVIVTGNYDSCKQTLTLKDTSGIEIYIK